MSSVRWAYFDTSVLVKRYVEEEGSDAARRLLQRYRFLSSAIVPVEVLSALSRRRMAGELTPCDFLAIKTRTYLKIVDTMNSRTYKSGHAASARRSMGADTRTFS